MLLSKRIPEGRKCNLVVSFLGNEIASMDFTSQGDMVIVPAMFLFERQLENLGMKITDGGLDKVYFALARGIIQSDVAQLEKYHVIIKEIKAKITFPDSQEKSTDLNSPN